MSQHIARIDWSLSTSTNDFSTRRYSREHNWTFDGGLTIPASSSPSAVPLPYSNPAYVDPEEAFVASLASCHMLWFLAIAAEAGFIVKRYTDNATGTLTREQDGTTWISTVTLNPQVEYSAEACPLPEEERDLHHRSHKACFLANSVKTDVVVKTDMVM